MNWGEVGPKPCSWFSKLSLWLLPDAGVPLQRFGGPDGIFGDKTKSTVAAFQQHHGLAGDGIVGRPHQAENQSVLPKAGKPLAHLPAVPAEIPLPYRTTEWGDTGDPRTSIALGCLNAEKVYGQYGFRVDEGPGAEVS